MIVLILRYNRRYVKDDVHFNNICMEIERKNNGMGI